jgi:hypothetical protein
MRTHAFVPALLAALSLAACGSKDEETTVRGWLFAEDGVVRLCDAIAESYPPQCGGTVIIVHGLDLSSIRDLQTAQGVSWASVTLRGTVRDGVLTVSENAQA